MRRFVTAIILMVLPATAAVALAVPLLIPYTGHLTESGTPVNGTRYFEFRIHDVPSGGAPLYTQAESLAVVGGVYHTELNASGGVWSGAERWLAISVNGAAELTPRTHVGTVPYAVRAQVADSATSVPQKGAWQLLFANQSVVAAGSWVDVGPSLTITTQGGPLLIVLDMYAVGGSHASFQPLVDGVWAGSYSGMLDPGNFWREGLLYTGGGTWQQWSKSKIYPGIPAGTHTVRVQALTDGGTLAVGNSSVPCALQIIELQRME